MAALKCYFQCGCVGWGGHHRSQRGKGMYRITNGLNTVKYNWEVMEGRRCIPTPSVQHCTTERATVHFLATETRTNVYFSDKRASERAEASHVWQSATRQSGNRQQTTGGGVREWRRNFWGECHSLAGVGPAAPQAPVHVDHLEFEFCKAKVVDDLLVESAVAGRCWRQDLS